MKRKESTTMNTTGKLTPKGKPSLRKEAAPNSPIYKRGYVIGVKRSINSSQSAKKPDTNREEEISDEAEPGRLKRLEEHLFDGVTDIELIKSYWISRRIEEMEEESDNEDEGMCEVQSRESLAGFDWPVWYESEKLEDLMKEDDPLLIEALEWLVRMQK